MSINKDEIIQRVSAAEKQVYQRDDNTNAILLNSRDEYLKASAAKQRREKIKKLNDSNEQLNIMTSIMLKKISKLEKELNAVKGSLSQSDSTEE